MLQAQEFESSLWLEQDWNNGRNWVRHLQCTLALSRGKAKKHLNAVCQRRALGLLPSYFVAAGSANLYQS